MSPPPAPRTGASSGSRSADPLSPAQRGRYSWLDGALALREGEFDEVTRHARYTAFLQPAAPA